jgi:hypothetical protein
MRSSLARWFWSLVLSLVLGAPAAVSAEATPQVIGARPMRAGLGDPVFVTVQGLKDYLMKGGQDACGDLILFLGEVPVPGAPEACDPYNGQVRFELDRTDDSDRAWHVLLSEPMSFRKKVELSVGTKGGLGFPSQVDKFELEIVPPFELVSFLVGLVLAFLLGLYLAKATPILRDRNAGVPLAQAPYSLSRFQLAFWSFLVIAAYIFIWMITEELDTITGSVLALLGIGSATALGSTIIDHGKGATAASATGDSVPAKPAVVSRGFLNDILSDTEGISIYRFQLFAWTLVLGAIFCASVYDGLQMPQFSTTLLGLMGVSSGTYLGFKVPEASTHD